MPTLVSPWGLSNIIGFDFDIQYKEGSSNVVENALSMKVRDELLTLVLSNASGDLLESIQLAWQHDSHLKTIMIGLQQDSKSHAKFFWIRYELRRKGKLVIGSNPAIKEVILKWLHSSHIGGHSSIDMITSKVKSLLYLKGMPKDIVTLVKNRDTCQNNFFLALLLTLVSYNLFLFQTKYGHV